MSRKGKMPICIPKGVEVHLQDGLVRVKGPKGELTQEVMAVIDVVQEENQLFVRLKEESRELRQFHGLYRALIANMVIGTSQGFEKRLEMIGVGYRAAVHGSLLDLQVGYSHPTQIEIPKGIEVKVEKNTQIIISGTNKQVVGQFAAEVRAKRPPEPYQGKGIRYANEYVRRKAGKAAKSGKK